MTASRLVPPWVVATTVLAIGILFSVVGPCSARATSSPRAPVVSVPPTALGVVWTPPARSDSALRELNRIARLGATTVRLSRLPSDTVAARADTLGLRLYVDLPIDYVSASQLQDSLARADAALKRARVLARRHPSITHVGLAHATDTTRPLACEVLRRWTKRIHGWDTSVRTYYVTPFAAGADRCADAVDRPLLDLRGHPAPHPRWRAWQRQTPSVGIGAVGTWTRPGAAPGLRVPHSVQRQARALERALSALLDTSRVAPPVLFVYRWRDRSSPLLSSRHYGLHDADGTPRPAARVVRGFYTGTQRTFAFPVGRESAPGHVGLTLLGWGLVALLGGLYARSPFVRRTGTRYFAAPGFYRDALRDGRDLHPGTNSLLLLLAAGATGGIGTRALRFAATQSVTEHLLAALPQTLQTVVTSGVEQPIPAGLFFGLAALALLLVWMTALVLTARWTTRLSFAQGLVLVVWPCWPVLVLLPLTLATGSGALLSPSLFAAFLAGGGLCTFLYVTGRVLYDYWAVTGLPGWKLLPLSLLSPLGVTSLLLVVLTEGYGVSLRFLWHLATLTS